MGAALDALEEAVPGISGRDAADLLKWRTTCALLGAEGKRAAAEPRAVFGGHGWWPREATPAPVQDR